MPSVASSAQCRPLSCSSRSGSRDAHGRCNAALSDRFHERLELLRRPPWPGRYVSAVGWRRPLAGSNASDRAARLPSRFSSKGSAPRRRRAASTSWRSGQKDASKWRSSNCVAASSLTLAPALGLVHPAQGPCASPSLQRAGMEIAELQDPTLIGLPLSARRPRFRNLLPPEFVAVPQPLVRHEAVNRFEGFFRGVIETLDFLALFLQSLQLLGRFSRSPFPARPPQSRRRRLRYASGEPAAGKLACSAPSRSPARSVSSICL